MIPAMKGEAVESMGLMLEVAGCDTPCMHCWAQGGRYPAMPLEDVAFALAEAQAFCRERGIRLEAFPMHEVAAHPRAAEVLRLFAGSTEFEPLATTGVPLALRDDWREVLAAAAQVGTRTIAVAFHGADEEHDRFVGRAGAFRETCRGIERARSAGLTVLANVFVTRNARALVEDLTTRMADSGVAQSFWEPARYNPTPRGRVYQAHRPRLVDLLPLGEQIAALSGIWKEKWRDLSAWAEAAHHRRALGSTSDDDWRWPTLPGHVELVVRPNLDLHAGRARAYGTRHGNLRGDGARNVLARAIAHGDESWDRLRFGSKPLPPVAELARRVGDAAGEMIYFNLQDMRDRWLDQHRAAG